MSTCTNSVTFAKLVPGSMQCKESATSSYLQIKKHENTVSFLNTVISCLIFVLIFFHHVLNAGQPQDFMHFFSSNIRPDKTILSPYSTATENKLRGARASLSIQVWV